MGSNNNAKNLESNSDHHSINYFTLILPLFVSLLVIAFLDLLSSLIVQPMLLVLINSDLFALNDKNLRVTLSLLANIVLNVCALAILFFFYFKRYKIIPRQVENKSQPNFVLLTLKTYVVMFTIIYVIGVVFILLQTKFFPNESLQSPYELIFPTDTSYSLLNFFLIILLVVIMAPILEEHIFRRLLIPLFEGTGKISTGMTVFLSSVIFGLIHTEADIINGSLFFAIIHFSSAFLLGLGLGGLFIITRNIKYPIILHAVNNGFALSIQFIKVLYPVTDPYSKIATPFVLIGLVILVVLGMGAIFIIITLLNLEKLRYNFSSQFKNYLSLRQKLGLTGLIIIVQGFLFVLLPYFNSILMNSYKLDDLASIVSKIILALVVFSISLLFILKNKEKVKTISQVVNMPLIPYEKHNVTPIRYDGAQSSPVEFIGNSQFDDSHTYQKICLFCNGDLPLHPDGTEVAYCPHCGQKQDKRT